MSSPFRRVLIALLPLSLATSAVLSFGGARVAASGAAFTCQPGFYQVSFGQLNLVNPVNGQYDPIGVAYADTYNALGYNPQDNFLYAIDTGARTGDLLKIANDGTATDLGRPVGLPASNFNAGDFDTNGNLVVSVGGSTPWYVVNVGALTATAYTVTGSASGNDMVLQSGTYYLLVNRSLSKVDYATGVATTVAVPGAVLPASGTYGTAWSDASGDLYFDNNGTGEVYQLSGYTTASPTATAVLAGQASGNNDAASCESAQSTFVPPTAAADSYSTSSAAVLNVPAPGVLGNDTAVRATAALVSSPTDATSFTLHADGSFTYTSSPGFSGTDSFTYDAVDYFGRTTAPATVSLRVAPVANVDSYATVADVTLTVTSPGVLTNDHGAGLNVTSTAPEATAAGGTATLDVSGAVTYVPPTGWSGLDTFPYTVRDSSAQTASTTVHVAVSPVAHADAYAATSGATLSAASVLANDVGAVLSAALVSGPVNGPLTLNANGTFAYSPPPTFSGTDGFTYRVTDGAGLTGTADVVLNVAPRAAGDSYSVSANGTLVQAAAGGVLTNDDGSALQVVAHSAPANGVLTMQADGSFTYQPSTNFAGSDTFTYTAQDSSGQTSLATVAVAVSAPAGPVAQNDTYTTSSGSGLTRTAGAGVLANDTGTGDAVTSHTSPSNGSLTVAPDGAFVYTPASGYSGPDSFTYTVTDSFARTSTATVTLSVTPVATDDTYSTPFQTDLLVSQPGVLGNDGGTLLTVTASSTPAHGTLTMNADGSLVYAPDPGYTGLDSFTYTATDGSSQSAGATVHLTVSVPGAPVAAADDYLTQAGSALTESAVTGLLANDSGSGIAVTSHTAPAHGSLTLTAQGSFTYTPSAGFSGHDSFAYTITDAFSRTSTTSVSLTAAPVAGATSATGVGAVPLVVTLPVPTGTGPFTYVLLTAPPTADGAASVDGATGVLTFTPAPGFSGAVPSFTYGAIDASGTASGAAAVTLTITMPPAPATTAVAGTTPAGTPVTIRPDPPTGTGPFHYALVTLPPAADGTATIDAVTGVITFTPAAGFGGIVPVFTYTVTDGFGQVSAAEDVTIVVGAAAAAVVTPQTGVSSTVNVSLSLLMVLIGLFCVGAGARGRRQRR